jgi:DNA/RNA-binding domain of Phe-tRNA-synthetase-like protein
MTTPRAVGMIDVTVADSWRSTHPDARVGVVALRNVANPARHDALDARREALEAAIGARFAGHSRAQLNDLPTIKAYNAFYRPFGKSYHVLLQLESIALKGKPLASPSALVQAMFMAEVEGQLLTAGHDLDAIAPPLTIAASTGDETYTRINGQAQQLKPADMYMTDARGIVSSVIYGPDQRTRITADTRAALFVAYAPAGIAEAALREHLDRIAEYVRLVSPAAAVDGPRIVGGA